MLISFVIPAYNSSATIGRTLASLGDAVLPESWCLEAVVVSDGGDDGEQLLKLEAVLPWLKLVRHETNLGMCAARNSGIDVSKGELVIILDSDDEMVPGWPQALARVMSEWPEELNVCYASCRTVSGRITSEEPGFSGLLSVDDILNERHTGEYLPMFRGNYLRNKKYIDLGTRKSCGLVSYISMALDAPFWVSSEVLRIYHENSSGSVTSGWTSPEKATETVLCYQSLFDRYGQLLVTRAPRNYRTRLLRMAVYLHLSGMVGGWRTWLRGGSFSAFRETCGAALILLLGRRAGRWFAAYAKRNGMVKRYG